MREKCWWGEEYGGQILESIIDLATVEYKQCLSFSGQSSRKASEITFLEYYFDEKRGRIY